ncbi:alkaline shock response membrane anchor protein AmaP, partial [Leuconostoc mesenteroides]|nr:alkaline shock response membrane anchor protein AmaP [Leuconostoc mesenteroides]
MKKSQKIVLSIFSLGYLVGLCLLIWPQIIDEVFKFLAEFNIHLDFKSDLFIYYYGLVLLALTVLVFLLILIWPVELPDI